MRPIWGGDGVSMLFDSSLPAKARRRFACYSPGPDARSRGEEPRAGSRRWKDSSLVNACLISWPGLFAIMPDNYRQSLDTS